MLYRGQGRYAEAEPLLRRALAIRMKTLGPEHPDVADRLNNLTLLYYNTDRYHVEGRYTEAEPLFRQALAIRLNALGPEHRAVAACLENYSSLLRTVGRWISLDGKRSG